MSLSLSLCVCRCCCCRRSREPKADGLHYENPEAVPVTSGDVTSGDTELQPRENEKLDLATEAN